jgi:hypothetical protein
MTTRRVILVVLAVCGVLAGVSAQPDPGAFQRAAANGRLVQEGLERSHRYLHAWLAKADPKTGLIPRNLTDSPYWNGRDSAADNYPFMVLSAWFTDRAVFDGQMRRMLETEKRVSAREGWRRLTDEYEFASGGLRFPKADANRIFFNSAEYVKDGLLALTEWLGPSPWSERMFELVDDSFALAATDTPFGKVPFVGLDQETGVEVSGDYLQALARIYWLSGGDEKYLEWGTRLADLYLLPAGKRHPTRDFSVLRLRDHGCEITSGLSEFYATLHFAGKRPGGARWAAKKAEYQPHVHEMLDRILAVGRNADGLFYNSVNPQTGAVVDARVSDGFGYVLDAFYTVYLVDGTEAYREAAFTPLTALPERYRGFAWEPGANAPPGKPGSHDGYADAIEGALNLMNRLPETDPRAVAAASWLDSEVREFWSRQQPDGIIEGWHGDGNFARTTIMYCLWKSQGISAHPWREDLRVGAVRDGDGVAISVSADKAWSGRLVFDRPRAQENLRLPIDWPRINQFPEWFTVQAERSYDVATCAPATSAASEKGPDGSVGQVGAVMVERGLQAPAASKRAPERNPGVAGDSEVARGLQPARQSPSSGTSSSCPGPSRTVPGADLRAGLAVDVPAGGGLRFFVTPRAAAPASPGQR